MNKLPKKEMDIMKMMFNKLQTEKDPVKRSQIFFTIAGKYIQALVSIGDNNKTDTPADVILFTNLMEYLDTCPGGETTKFHKLLFMKSVLEEHIKEETEEIRGTLH